MSLRIEKVNQLLKQQVSQILLKEVDFGRSLVTIISVDTSPDLKQAKIKISIIPTKENEQVLRVIQKNIFGVQQELNKKLYMKPVPKIRFEIDKIEEKAQEVERILGKVEK